MLWMPIAVPEPPAGASGAADVVDLGCGNGAIAAFVALAHPDLRILATDQSASATASAAATASANGVADRITVSRDDALSALPDASAVAQVWRCRCGFELAVPDRGATDEARTPQR